MTPSLSVAQEMESPDMPGRFIVSFSCHFLSETPHRGEQLAGDQFHADGRALSLDRAQIKGPAWRP
jgi:hypothetical protein